VHLCSGFSCCSVNLDGFPALLNHAAGDPAENALLDEEK
jgi:hypothetical protein